MLRRSRSTIPTLFALTLCAPCAWAQFGGAPGGAAPPTGPQAEPKEEEPAAEAAPDAAGEEPAQQPLPAWPAQH